MSESRSERLGELVSLLGASNLEPTAEEMADLLWLAVHRARGSHISVIQEDREDRGRKDDPPTSLQDKSEDGEPEPLYLKTDQPSLYPQTSNGVSDGIRRGRPVRVPGVRALPDALGITRALRPLRMWVPSVRVQHIDEEATAQRIAEAALARRGTAAGLWLPKFRPARERWLSLELVIDANPSMRIWTRAVEELKALLRTLGAFHTLRVWSLDACQGSQPTVAGVPGGLVRNPNELLDSAGRRLVLVVTDAVAPGWYVDLGDLLKRWARHQPVAVLQLLPRRLWHRTGLINASLARVRSSQPGAANSRLQQESYPPEVRPPIPITLPDPAALAAWAKMVAGNGGDRVTAAIFHPLDPRMDPRSEEEDCFESFSAEERIRAFRANASPLAFRLACLFSTVPLTLPVMRLVQRVLLPESRQDHLAEVFLGGLLQQPAEFPQETDAEHILYDFHPGVRELLRKTLDLADTVRAERLMSRFLATHYGQALNFRALVEDPEGTIALPPGAKPFANGSRFIPMAIDDQATGIAAFLEDPEGPIDVPPHVSTFANISRPILMPTGVPIAISVGSVHYRDLNLEAGDFLHVVAMQQGIDVLVRLIDANGEIVCSVDSPNGSEGPEELVEIVSESGSYRIEVVAVEAEAPPGHYTFEVWNQRPATIEDRKLVNADHRYHKGRQLAKSGNYEEAIESLRRALDTWQNLGIERREADTLDALGFVHLGRRELHLGLVFTDRAAELYRRLNDRRRLAVAINRIGVLRLRLGQTAQAFQALEEALNLYTELGIPRGEAICLARLGVICRRNGEIQQALAHFERALELIELEPSRMRASILVDLASTLLRLNRPREAYEHYHEAQELYRQENNAAGIAHALEGLANAASELGRAGEAITTIEEALELLSAIDYPDQHSAILCSLRRLRSRNGEPPEARIASERPAEGAENMMTDVRLRLRLLHLSDLHARAGRESEPWRRRRLLGPAWEANLNAILEDGPIDLVCFTGDAANWGKREEFAEAAEFLAALLDRLGLPPKRLFVVPGNHDVDRSIHPDVWEALRQAAGKVDELGFGRWMAGGDAPRTIEPSWRARVLERQTAYRSWVRLGLGRPELAPATASQGLGYRALIELRGLPIHVVGLDTAWLCGDDADVGRLRVTDEQVMRLLTDDRGEPLSGLRLVLMHHPLHDLADGDRVRALLAEHADLVLRGHLHATELFTWADPDRSLRQLAAGCLYEGDRADRWPNVCQVVTLDLGAGGRPQRVEIRLRRFSPEAGHWFDDDGLYRESRHGRISWILPSAPAHRGRTGSNPFDPWNLVVPPRFQGRTLELQRLEAALGQGHGISIVGDSPIGKSSLLRTFEERLAAGGHTVRRLDGQGPEGVSEAAFVARVTDRPAAEGAEAAADVLAAWATAEPEGLPPVLLVDEFDGLPARFDPRFFERLRHLLGRIVVVTASRREVDELFAEVGRTSPFDNRMSFLRLGLLGEDAAEAVIHLGDGVLDAEDARLLKRWAGRHPLYLQLLGHCLVEARHLGESRAVALDRFRDEAERRLRDLWRRLEVRDQEILRAVVRGERDKGSRRLVRRGLLDANGRPFGEVLAAWLLEEAL